MAGIEPKTRADLGWDVVAEGWARRCHTERGSARVLERELLDRETAVRQLAQIDEARVLRGLEAPMVFGGITDVHLALARAEKGAPLDPEALVAVARTLRGCAALAKGIRAQEASAPELVEVAAVMRDLGHVYFPILEAFDEDGSLSDHASDALGGLRRRVGKLVVALDEKARALIDDTKMAVHLQDRFYTQREDRYVIPVKVESRSRVPGIVHGTSQSGQTVFIEPQVLVELNNKLKLAECEVIDEERRIYAALTAYVSEETGSIRLSLEAATELDVIDAAALLADTLGATTPTLDDEKPLELVNARHPAMVLSGKECIPNDIRVGLGKALVISGPNAGGKTVALKTTGLAALMVRAGLPVAADAGSRLPWFETVASDIGDSQSLEMDLSTFSARLLRLGEFLNTANYKSLVLIDEIAVGTEPEQGASLAQAVLEQLIELGATVIVTTHYERLKMLAGGSADFENASVGFDIDKLEPTFKLVLGIPGASGALRVARRLGLQRTVIARAQGLLGDSRATVDALIDSLEQARAELETEKAALAAARNEVADAHAAAAIAEKRAKALEKRAREGAHSDATVALKEARRQLESASVRIRKKVDASVLKDVESSVDDAARQISTHAPERPVVGRAANREELVIGALVYVPSLDARGEVLDAPRGKKVMVAVGSLKSSVAVSELRIEPGRTRAKKKPPRSQGASKVRGKSQSAASTGADIVRTPETTLDLRGQRADEAVDELDRCLDRSLMRSLGAVFVIHGHGTGALRNAVRSHLASHPAVVSWRPGELREGGDGVTVASLDV